MTTVSARSEQGTWPDRVRLPLAAAVIAPKSGLILPEGL